MKYLT